MKEEIKEEDKSDGFSTSPNTKTLEKNNHQQKE